MLHNILVHHLVIELERALLCQIIIDLTLFRLDNVGTLGVDGVGQRVLIKINISSALLLEQMVLVLPAGFLLIHESASWRFVLLHARVVEVAHDFVELIHVEVVTHTANRRAGRFLV